MMRILMRVAVFALSVSLYLGDSRAEVVVNQPAPNAAAAEKPTVEQQVIIQAQLIEVSGEKLRKLGCTFSTCDGRSIELLTPKDIASLYTEKPAGSAAPTGLLDALCQHGVAHILTAPTIATLDGRPASMTSGGIVTIEDGCDDGKQREFIGAKLDVTPTLAGTETVCLDLKLVWSELVQNTNADDVGSNRVLRREVDTAFVARLGETFLLAGSRCRVKDTDQGESTTLLLVVKPSLVSDTSNIEQAKMPVAQGSTQKKSLN